MTVVVVHVQMASKKEQKPKRPCTGYMLFMSDFMKKNATQYRAVTDAVSAGLSRLRI